MIYLLSIELIGKISNLGIRLKLTNLAHYDGAINGKFKIRQCLPDGGYYSLHTVDLLS